MSAKIPKRLIAAHEAAHFVAGFKLNAEEWRYGVSIVRRGDTLGIATGEGNCYLSATDTGEFLVIPSKVEDKVVELYCGYAAMTLLRPECRREARLCSSDDDRQAHDLLERLLKLSGRSLSDTKRRLRRRATRFVKSHRDAILAVARELLDHDEIDFVWAELVVGASEGDADARKDLPRYRATMAYVKRDTSP